MDVSGAYESLPHEKLIEVIGQALSPVQDELFTVRRYSKIWADSHEGLKKAFIRQVLSYTNILYVVCSAYTETIFNSTGEFRMFANTGRFPGG